LTKIFLVEGRNVPYAVTQEGQKIQRFFPGDDGGQYMVITWQVPRLVKAHYHPTDQFQVFLEGETTFPDHKLFPLDAHYSDTKTPYGPFVVESTGNTVALLRQRKVGFVDMDEPPSYGAGANKEGKEVFFLASATKWENVGNGVRRKVTGAGDGKGPEYRIMEGAKGAVLQTGSAPYGEFVIFCKGSFTTSGRDIESYSVRFVEGKEATPPITCRTDGATIISAKFYRPAPAGEPERLAGETFVQ